MLENNINTTFCSDNRTVSKTTVTREILLALAHFPFTQDGLRNTVIHGFKSSFFPESYAKKRAYVQQCIDYYDKLAAEFGTLKAVEA